jgi:hypothetical protein
MERIAADTNRKVSKSILEGNQARENRLKKEMIQIVGVVEYIVLAVGENRHLSDIKP